MSDSSNSNRRGPGPTIDYQGHGAQTAHLGQGDQHVNASGGVQNINTAEGQLVNIQKFFHVAGTESLRLPL